MSHQPGDSVGPLGPMSSPAHSVPMGRKGLGHSEHSGPSAPCPRLPDMGRCQRPGDTDRDTPDTSTHPARGWVLTSRMGPPQAAQKMRPLPRAEPQHLPTSVSTKEKTQDQEQLPGVGV